MAKRDFGPRSRRAHPPAHDGTIAAASLGLPGVMALTRRTERVIHNETTTLADYVEALYDPDQAMLSPAIGAGARTIGTVRHKLHARRRWGRPQILFLYGPLFEVPGENGAKDYMAPTPPCFDPETGIDEELVAELIADLPHFGIDALSRRSFVSDARILAIAEAHKARQPLAMAEAGFAPSCLAIDTVFLAKKVGDKRKALHVTAADPMKGIYCTLALIPFVANDKAPVIARLAEVLKELPHPEALLATATDDGVERDIVAAAVASAKAERPALAPTPVLDHVPGRGVGGRAQVRGQSLRRASEVQEGARQPPTAVRESQPPATIRRAPGYQVRLYLCSTFTTIAGVV